MTALVGNLAEHFTVRELIEKRIQQEVDEYNASQPECFQGLVAPLSSERTDHGYKLWQRRHIDGHQQFLRALEAFEHKGFMVLVDDQVATSLDQQFDIKPLTQVSFVKLTPLVAG